MWHVPPLGSLDGSSRRSRRCIFSGTPPKALFSASHHSRKYLGSVCLTTGASNCGHAVKTVSLGVFHGILTLFPFVLNKYLIGRILETAHIPFLTLPRTDFSIRRWFLAATVILRCLPNGDFSPSVISFTIANWNFCKEALSFLLHLWFSY